MIWYILLVIAELALVIANIAYAPLGMLVYPFLFTAIACINLLLSKKSYVITIIVQFLLIVINDIGYRYYTGQKMDHEGAAWITMLSLLSFLFSLIVMFIYLPVNKTERTSTKFKSLFGFIAASALYLIASLNWGVNVFYP